MTATTRRLRGRTEARRKALARQQKLNEERERRDAQELDLATAFALGSEDLLAARAAVHAAELAQGRVVDTLIGQLRIRYDRAAHLLDTSEDELRRLRQVATEDTAGGPDPPAPRKPARPGRPARTRPTPTPLEPQEPGGDTHRDQPGDATVP